MAVASVALFSMNSCPSLRMSTTVTAESVKASFQIWTTSMVSWSDIGGELRSFPHGALDGTA